MDSDPSHEIRFNQNYIFSYSYLLSAVDRKIIIGDLKSLRTKF